MTTLSLWPIVLLSIATPAPAADDLAARCEREVIELHVFFEEWFHARLDDTDAAYARFADAMAADMIYIGPGGNSLTRQPLLTGLRGRHGAWKGSEARIWIEAVETRDLGGGLALVTYEEWQTDPAGDTRARRSTILLEVSDAGPAGLVWRHVHETWMPESVK
ncbi:MAG: hypothetical protein AAGE94_03705 [Acidobacteriota bacterium]